MKDPVLKYRYDTPKKASQRLGVCSQTLRRWASQGDIRFVLTPGGHFRYAVDEYVAQNDAEPEPPAPVVTEAPRLADVVAKARAMPDLVPPPEPEPILEAVMPPAIHRPQDAQIDLEDAIAEKKRMQAIQVLKERLALLGEEI